MGSSIIRAYHARRVMPLMRRMLSLYAMAPEASFVRTVLAKGALSPSEVAQRIKETMEPLQDDAGVPSTLFTRCQGILRCGRSKAMLSS